jgi:site-specific DNA-methyltransferase (adenine-specific)
VLELVVLDKYKHLVHEYPAHEYRTSLALHSDCFEWLKRIPEQSIHAVVTDPPYGVKEYDLDQLEKKDIGKGGVWRIPPSFDGNVRSPLPRFTALNHKEKDSLCCFFQEWAKAIDRVICPGGHIFIASNSFLSQLVFQSLVDGGLEYRGTIMRLVRTLRGGDRPKNAEIEFDDVCSLPRGCFEPWGLFRKPLDKGMKVSDCLREFGTGGLRRKSDGNPFEDVIQSERTSQKERSISDHPSLKPQSLMRKLVYASLPLGKGLVLDPFMGSGSTLAAAAAIGYDCIGIERHPQYFNQSHNSISKLASLETENPQLSIPLSL